MSLLLLHFKNCSSMPITYSMFTVHGLDRAATTPPSLGARAVSTATDARVKR